MCFEKQLIVEVDDWAHQLEQSWKPDNRRQAWLEAQGYTVMRFDDDDVRNDCGAVADAIYAKLYPSHNSR